jgi:ABC-type branched-subunit amino acid transport system substrate-binding protein
MGPGQCIGVTNGSAIFESYLAAAEEKILGENAWVTAGGKPFVSIAYLLPMTVTAADTESQDAVRHQLEGAYAAQYEANHSTRDGKGPLIRLLLANDGSQAAYWSPVVQELAGRLGAPDHLVAVAGLGPSVQNTLDATDQLNADGIPMVGSVITGSILESIPDLVRVSPSNSDEVAAALSYLRSVGKTSSILIQDTNPFDDYATTLGSAFMTSYLKAGLALLNVESYDSRQSINLRTYNEAIVDICSKIPDFIYFAGRGKDLAGFIEQLAGSCGGTILTGDDASQLRVDSTLEDHMSNSHITVMFTALANPGEWKDLTAVDPRAVASFKRYFGEFFPEDQRELGDGEAVMAHDAVLAAVTAIRLAAGPADREVSPSEVVSALHQVGEVAGVGGWISIGPDGDPTDKAIPILQLNPDGTVTFVRLSSPTGTPLGPPSR